MPKSRAICILGMHRSGTSALTRAINLLGVDIGPSENIMLPAEGNNPEGFWEHLQIVDIHDKILKLFFRQWDSNTPLPSKWWKTNEVGIYKEKLKQIVIEQFIDKPVWTWKDPRTCILLPIWKEIFEELNIDVNYVITLRNPLDVAASLFRRDGFNQDKALGIWTLYNLSALFWTNEEKKILIHFDDLIDNWNATLKKVAEFCGISWPSGDKELELIAAINAFIKPKLRHSQTNFRELLDDTIPKTVIDVYQLCMKLEEGLNIDNQIASLYEQYESYSRILSNSQTLKNDQIIELFWSENGTFNQDCSSSLQVIPDGFPREYLFKIPPNTTSIRIDPVNFTSLIIIHSIELLQTQNMEDRIFKQINVWSRDNQFEGVFAEKEIVVMDRSKDLSMLAIDGDPSILLSVPHNKAETVLKVVMRVILEITKETIDVFVKYKENLFENANLKKDKLIKKINELENSIQTFSNVELENDSLKHQLIQSKNEYELKEKELKLTILTNSENINSLQSKIINLTEEIIKLKDENTSVQIKTTEMDFINLQLSNQLHAITNSSSWKLTWPLRWLKNKLNNNK